MLIYRRPVVRHKRDHSVSEVAAPSNVLEGCVGDVSVIAGLMVDKAVYHLPLYRQHQRLLDSGIRVSRSTLLNWINKGIELLRPLYQAQWRYILQRVGLHPAFQVEELTPRVCKPNLRIIF